MKTHFAAIALALVACGDDSDAPGNLADASVDASSNEVPSTPVLETWSMTTPVPGEAIAYPNVVTLDDEVWVVGGRKVNTDTMAGGPVSTVQAYDPANDSWEKHEDLPVALDLPNVAASGGRLWILGAKGATDLFSYDPKRRTWSAEGKRPITRGIGASALAVAGTSIYVVGGVVTSATNPRGLRLRDVAVFDTKTREWRELPPIPDESAYFGAGIIDDVLYATGGSTETDPSARPGRTFALDLKAETWSEKAALPTPVSSFGSAVVGGRLYVIGGITGGTGAIYPQVQAYDVDADEWSLTTEMPTPRFSLGASTLDGRIYVVGGVLQSSEITFEPTPIVEVLAR
jgi:N-acetylneuraminic acid mutarotase